MTNQITNQKELSVRQIRTMLKDAEITMGQPYKPTTKEIVLSLENEQIKTLVYKTFELYSELKKLRAKVKRLKLKKGELTA
jgi:hypothetical protein